MSAELPKGTYLFSFFSKRAVPVLVRRAWWKVFGRDRIELAQREERTVLAGLSAEEATVIRDLARDWLSPGGRVLTRLMGQAPSKVQLELGALSSSYVATTTTPRDPFVAPVLTYAQVAEAMERLCDTIDFAGQPLRGPLGRWHGDADAEALARADAEAFGAGFLVDGLRVDPKRVRVFSVRKVPSAGKPLVRAETTFWHDYPACGLYRGGRCTCDAQGDAP